VQPPAPQVQKVKATRSHRPNKALGLVRDIKSCSHVKTEIKTALKLAMAVTTDAAVARAVEEGAYISLADFQSLTDSEPNGIKRRGTRDMGANLARLSEIASPGMRWNSLQSISVLCV
jgi:hypothetical protein